MNRYVISQTPRDLLPRPNLLTLIPLRSPKLAGAESMILLDIYMTRTNEILINYPWFYPKSYMVKAKSFGQRRLPNAGGKYRMYSPRASSGAGSQLAGGSQQCVEYCLTDRSVQQETALDITHVRLTAVCCYSLNIAVVNMDDVNARPICISHT